MNNIKEAIKSGEKSVIQYLVEQHLKDSDIPILKSYIDIMDKDKNLIQQLNDCQKNMVQTFVKDINKQILNTPNFVLLKSLSKKGIDINLIFDELISRFENNKINLKEILGAFKKHDSIELLKKLPKEVQKEYRYKTNFFNLDDEKNFNRFYEIQSSGIYHRAVTSFNEFKKTLALWDSKKEQIKECFSYFDLTIISNVAKYEDIRLKECLEYYVQTHVKNQSYIWPFANEKNIHNVETYKKQIKEDLTNLCSKLNMNKEVELLKSYDINEKLIIKCSHHKP